MLARDVFQLQRKLFERGDAAPSFIECYWWAEMDMAHFEDRPFSDLEILGSEEKRRCEICGTVSNSNNDGLCESCDNAACEEIRGYFSICDYPYARRKGGAGANNHVGLRAAFLGGKLRSDGYKRISDIPVDIRFNYLITAMLERVVSEKRRNFGEFSGENNG